MFLDYQKILDQLVSEKSKSMSKPEDAFDFKNYKELWQATIYCGRAKKAVLLFIPRRILVIM